MLRNWTEKIPAGYQGAGSLVSGTRFAGVRGNQVPLTGAVGGSVFANDGVAPLEYARVLFTDVSNPAALTVFEDGSGFYTQQVTARQTIIINNVIVATGIPFVGYVGQPVVIGPALYGYDVPADFRGYYVPADLRGYDVTP